MTNPYEKRRSTPDSETPFKVGPDQKTTMTWKTFWGAMALVAASALGYASMKTDQTLMKTELIFQGERLDQVDQRMANFEKIADRQTEILLLLARERRIDVPKPPIGSP